METPEQKARRAIDTNLSAAGRIDESKNEIDLAAERGISACGFATAPVFGFTENLLATDRKEAGAIEARSGHAQRRRKAPGSVAPSLL